MKKIILVISLLFFFIGNSQKVNKIQGLPLLNVNKVEGVNWLHPTYTQQFAQTANDSLVNVENLNCVEKLSVQLNGQESFVFFPSAVSTDKLHYEDVNRGLEDFTVVRNSTATRVNDKNIIEEVNADIARIDYSDATFIEIAPESINLALHSEDFSDVVYVGNSGGTSISPQITADYGVAPDGTSTADRIIFDLNSDATGFSKLTQTSTITITGDETQSVWLKSLGSNVTILLGGSQTGTMNVTTEWQRFEYTPPSIISSLFVLMANGSAGTSDFADLLVWGGQLSPTDELTRYVPTTSVIDGVPPLYDMEGCGVLLTELQSTNLSQRSEEFDNAYWIQGGTTSTTADTTIAPDGTLTAETLSGATDVAFNGNNLRRNNFSVTSLTTYTGTIYVKNKSSTTFGISLRDNSTGSLPTTSITPSNEWQRVEVSLTTGAGTSTINFQIGGADDEVYIWGAQLEESSTASSYIKTEGSTVTRLADEITDGGTVNDFNSEEGVLFVEMAALVNDQTFREITISDGTTSNRLEIRYTNITNDINAVYRVEGVQQASFSKVLDILDFHKIAFKWKVNDFALWIDGVLIGTDNSGSINPANTFNDIEFANSVGGQNFYGKTKQIKVYPTALTDEELIELTSPDPITIKAVNGIDLPDSDLTYNYVQDVSEEGLSFENIPAVYEGLNSRGNNASFVMIPSGYESTALIPQVPIKDSLEFNSDGDDWYEHWFNVSRASVATRVNEQGLIEEVGNNVPRIDFSEFTYEDGLGDELVVNGGFDTDSDWTKGTGITISSGNAHFTGQSGQYLLQDVISQGTVYKMTIDITVSTTGEPTIFAGAGNNIGGLFNFNGVGSYSATFTAGGVDDNLYIGSLFTGSIDNVSIKEVVQVPVYGSGEGVLLTENQSTNLLLRSQEFDNASWGKSNATANAVSEINIFGTTNTYEFKEDTTTNQHILGAPNNITVSATPMSGCIFAKQGIGDRWLMLQTWDDGYINGSKVFFNLSNGTVVSSNGLFTDASIEDFGNGWYKCTANFTPTTTNLPEYRMQLTDGGTTNYLGDGVSSIYLSAVQLEQNSVSSSYIKTEGSTVTRLKDEITNGGTVNDFNSVEGVLYCEIEPIQTGTKIALYDSATNFDNRVTIEIQTNTAYRFIYESDDLNKILTVNVSDTLLPANIAFCWRGTDIKIYIDGVEVASNGNANPFTPDILNTLSFTNAFGNGDFFYGKTKQIKVYKSIADAQKDLPYITN